MNSSKRLNNIAGWTVFAIAMVVYFFSAERTGSLWDCGEFITGADKLQVVHPPGAPLFLLIGRMFTAVARLISDNPADIAFSVNLLSGVCSAFAATFICWVTIMLGKLALVGREGNTDNTENMALAGAGVVAGLATAFCSSIWFSAVEGEVYAMSTFFTTLTLWAMIKWYTLPDEPDTDRWMIFAVFSAGLSIGVHLLSLLTFPALAMFYYYKKRPSDSVVFKTAGILIGFFLIYSLIGKIDSVAGVRFIRLVILAGVLFFTNRLTGSFKKTRPVSEEEDAKVSLPGAIGSAVIGVVLFVFIQTFIITGIPEMWRMLELVMVNGLGMPFQSGVYPLILILGLIFGGGFYMAHRSKSATLQKIVVAGFLVTVGFSTIAMVVIRANANTPINMNDPSDPMRLLPYINREQYGERPLLRGPSFDYNPRSVTTISEDRYGQVGDRYEIVDQKNSYEFDDSEKMLFPRMGHQDEARKQLYRLWMRNMGSSNPNGKPTMADNLKFFFRYQVNWMYWRYFMWNFAGRQNGEQGFYPWNPKSGHWLSGLKPLDSARLYNQSELPDSIKNHEARNTYYMLPLIFGLVGIFFHFRRRPNDAFGLLALFVITGLGIIVYSNQPPNEPRERDYVLVGSFFTYCIWMGMGALAIFKALRERIGNGAAPAAIALVMLAPILMGTQNFDDHSRQHHSGARDYANNFLESCAPNAIVFTYGDNDTYPLWYAQEIENIRTDVRVVNLSLIAVDWYIDQLRRQVNKSPAIEMSIPSEAYRGRKRIQIPINPYNEEKAISLQSAMKFVSENHEIPLQSGRSLESFLPSDKLYIRVDSQQVVQNGTVSPRFANQIADQVNFKIPADQGQWLLKGDIAVLDIIASNAFKRPIYFAVTCRPSSMLGLQNYTQLEGLALRLVPIKSQQDARYGMVGYGVIQPDSIYQNVTQDFKWGGFDQHDTYVDRSYGPSIQSMRALLMRTSQKMIDQKDNARAVDLVDRYFASFPHNNFPYDINTMFFLQVYAEADAYDKGKPHMETLANETEQQLRFLQSLELEDMMIGFSNEAASFLRLRIEIPRLAEQAGDKAFADEWRTRFAAFDGFDQEFRALTSQQRGNSNFRD